MADTADYAIDRLGLKNTAALLSALSDGSPITEDELAALVTDEDVPSLLSVASNPSASAGLLRTLSKVDDGMVRRLVAENPSTPADVLHGLAQDGDWKVRRAVAHNPSTPEATLMLLADTEVSLGPFLDRYSKEFGITPEELLLVALGWTDNILETLAANPSIPDDALHWHGKQTRFSDQHLAQASCNEDELRHLASSPYSSVRMLVAHNPSVPWDVLKELAEDPDPDVSLAAELEIEKFGHPRHGQPAIRWGRGIDAEDIESFLSSHGISASQEQLAKDQGWLEPFSATRSREETEPILRMLASDVDENARHWVAKRVDAPADVLSRLAKDESPYVREAVASNIHTPSEALAALAQENLASYEAVWEHPATDWELVDNFLTKENCPVLTAVAGNPNASEEVLKKVAQLADEVIYETIVVYHPEAEGVIRDLAERFATDGADW